ncbi:hypothetical protein BaRGS_00004057, partial [Batillaria attramentaria]
MRSDFVAMDGVASHASTSGGLIPWRGQRKKDDARARPSAIALRFPPASSLAADISDHKDTTAMHSLRALHALAHVSHSVPVLRRHSATARVCDV